MLGGQKAQTYLTKECCWRHRVTQVLPRLVPGYPPPHSTGMLVLRDSVKISVWFRDEYAMLLQSSQSWISHSFYGSFRTTTNKHLYQYVTCLIRQHFYQFFGFCEQLYIIFDFCFIIQNAHSREAIVQFFGTELKRWGMRGNPRELVLNCKQRWSCTTNLGVSSQSGTLGSQARTYLSQLQGFNRQLYKCDKSFF